MEFGKLKDYDAMDQSMFGTLPSMPVGHHRRKGLHQKSSSLSVDSIGTSRLPRSQRLHKDSGNVLHKRYSSLTGIEGFDRPRFTPYQDSFNTHRRSGSFNSSVDFDAQTSASMTPKIYGSPAYSNECLGGYQSMPNQQMYSPPFSLNPMQLAIPMETMRIQEPKQEYVGHPGLQEYLAYTDVGCYPPQEAPILSQNFESLFLPEANNQSNSEYCYQEQMLHYQIPMQPASMAEYQNSQNASNNPNGGSSISMARSLYSRSETPMPAFDPVMSKSKEISADFVCRYGECTLEYHSAQQLSDHVIEMHLLQINELFPCMWKGCIRANKPFLKKSKLKNHLSTHTGLKAYRCPVHDCLRAFSRQDGLTTHLKVFVFYKTHSGIKEFVCNFESCGKEYYHARSLRKHQRLHTFLGSALPSPDFNEQNELLSKTDGVLLIPKIEIVSCAGTVTSDTNFKPPIANFYNESNENQDSNEFLEFNQLPNGLDVLMESMFTSPAFPIESPQQRPQSFENTIDPTQSDTLSNVYYMPYHQGYTVLYPYGYQ